MQNFCFDSGLWPWKIKKCGSIGITWVIDILELQFFFVSALLGWFFSFLVIFLSFLFEKPFYFSDLDFIKYAKCINWKYDWMISTHNKRWKMQILRFALCFCTLFNRVFFFVFRVTCILLWKNILWKRFEEYTVERRVTHKISQTYVFIGSFSSQLC